MEGPSTVKNDVEQPDAQPELEDLGRAEKVTRNGTATVTEAGRGHGKSDPTRGIVA